MYTFLKENFNDDWIKEFKFLHTIKFKKLMNKLNNLVHLKRIQPKLSHIFKIFKTIPIKDIKVVFVVKEPYKIHKQACGIPFALKDVKYITPLLDSIFDELEREYGERPTDKTLKHWLDQGVLPIYSNFTTEAYIKSNHIDIWFEFTKQLLGFLSNKGIIFVFFGTETYGLMNYLDPMLDKVMFSPNPVVETYKSKSFFGCGIFNRLDKELKQTNNFKINWIKND